MSSHLFTNSVNREVRWGLDLPTGGFFYNEFYTEAEMAERKEYDTLASSGQGLTLSELLRALMLNFSFNANLEEIAYDLKTANPPTQLQHNVSKMFGVNLMDKLVLLDEDLQRNWS